MVGPDYQRPEMEMAEDWHIDLAYRDGEGDPLSDSVWTDIFRDEELRASITTALEHNRTLLIAIERIEEARAVNRITRSALFPTIDLALDAEREHESALTEVNARTKNEIFFGPTFAWELDLWGGNRRTNNAAYADYLAAGYGAQAVRLSLIADVSRAYFELQGVESRLETSIDTLGAREHSLLIARKRHKGGITSKLEVIQSEVEMASTRARIPVVEQNKLAVENQLSVLMGMTPQHQSMQRSLADQFIPARVTAGLPSSLLQRRPDIMKTEQELIAASELIGASKARLFPNIRLTGDLGFQSAAFSDLLSSDGKFWIIELDVVMPLFNAGARRAELSAAESRFNQSRLNYEQVVLEALREVSDALNQFYKSGESLQALLDLERSSAEYLGLAEKRYRNGVLAYLDVLDAQRLLFEAQISVSDARQAQLFALVDLYKALGGGWDPQVVLESAEN
jgi:multidrug efflux system outer membrane protein